MKDQHQLFSQLYVATQVRKLETLTQVRDVYMDEFVKHETLSHPLLLFKHGVMQPGDKLELIPILKREGVGSSI